MSRPKSKYYDLMFDNGKDTKEYRAYWGMIKRCDRDPNYVDRYVDDWFLDGEEGFKRFLDDVGPCPDPSYDLDRRKNELGYVRGNLRWATRSDNLRNRSNTLMVELKDGSTIPLMSYCENTGSSYARLRQKYRGGMLLRKYWELA